MGGGVTCSTGPPARFKPGFTVFVGCFLPTRLPVHPKSTCFLRYVVGVSSAVIGSGVHVTMVAMANNASGIRKAFLK